MRDYIGYSNGDWIPDSQFSIDSDALGYMLGVVVFETLSLPAGQSVPGPAHALWR